MQKKWGIGPGFICRGIRGPLTAVSFGGPILTKMSASGYCPGRRKKYHEEIAWKRGFERAVTYDRWHFLVGESRDELFLFRLLSISISIETRKFFSRC